MQLYEVMQLPSGKIALIPTGESFVGTHEFKAHATKPRDDLDGGNKYKGKRFVLVPEGAQEVIVASKEVFTAESKEFVPAIAV